MTAPFVDKLTDALASFLGSWKAVIVHTVWFVIWLLFHFSLETLTLFVSLEAIFIGIFLLMASNRAEVQRDRFQARVQAKLLTDLAADVDIDQKHADKLNLLLREISQIKAQLKTLNSFHNSFSSMKSSIFRAKNQKSDEGVAPLHRGGLQVLQPK